MNTTRTVNTTPLWAYALLWLFYVYLYVQILSFNQGDIQNMFLGGMYFIQFGIHEASHIVTMLLPPVVTAASGSISEILFTVLITLMCFRRRSYIAAGFGILWMMLAMSSAGRYMADAQTQVMPLIGPGANPQHDWNFVFSELGWLQQCVAIGDGLRIFGYVIGAVGLVITFGVIVAIAMKRAT